MPAWLHLDWFLFGALAGSTAISVFWLWAIDRRDRVMRGRERWQRTLAQEQDAQIRGLYQQTERLGRLVIEHALPPAAPHRSCQLVWPTRES